MRKRSRQRLTAVLAVVCMVIGFLSWPAQVHAQEKKQEKNKEVELRFVVTTDIHGQIMSADYETGKENAHGGIEKLLTKIREVRSETEEANTFTFDLGDILFDYTTENIFTTDSTAQQPIWSAYKQIGYDAFTLGNHDFDYGYAYIMEQLIRAGLTRQCVVSNLKKSASGEYPFQETMMINRLVKTTDGDEILMQIGIIGETVPTLSQKTEVMTGELATEGMVKNAEEKAKKLKAAGADLVIVLAHSGIGGEEPAELAENTAYALTKIPEVDVVFAGHEHGVFPGGSKDAQVYAMPGADPETGLVNGKNLVMAGSRGDNLGVVDLKCEIQGEKAVIKERTGSVLSIDPDIVDSAPEITKEAYGTFLDMFQEHHTKTIATIADGVTYQNYFGMVEDNAAIQLVNSAKIAYGLKYQNSPKGAKYSELPVVACSGYNYFGQKVGADGNSLSSSDYVNLSGAITGADLTAMQTYHAYIVLYQVTGAQLKEYIEWSASAYATLGEKQEWEDMFMNIYQESSGLPALFFEDWWNDWSNFRIFDGVEYTVDPSVPPRYTLNGTKINNTERVTALTINGVPVKDSDVMILASDRILKPAEANLDITKIQLLGGYVSSQNYFVSWLEEAAKAGEISLKADRNWKLKLPADYVFLTNSYVKGEEYAEKEDWFVSKFISDGDTSYYMGIFRNTEDKTGPNLVVTPNVAVPTNNSVVLAVSANDVSGLKKVQYYKGVLEPDDRKWENAVLVKDGKVSVSANGSYMFRAEDTLGNVTFSTVVVDNIDKDILQVPTVNTYSNRMASITGTAEPNATVCIKASGKSYTVKVDKEGSFSYALPNQPSGSKLEVYVKDTAGRISKTITVQVKRTGPNRPSVSSYVKNKQTQIKGKVNDDDAETIALIGSRVYGTKKGLERYRYSKLFNSAKTLVETTVDVAKDGSYVMKIPVQKVDTVVSVYNLDSLYRAGRKWGTYVREQAPNQPDVFVPCSVERQVRGTVVQLKKNERYAVTVTVDGQTYTGETLADGSFCVDTGKLSAGDTVKVVLSDLGTEKVRRSAARSVTVADYGGYVNSEIRFDPVYADTKVISGTYQAGGKLTLVLDTSTYEVECDENGAFRIEVKNRIFTSSNLYAVARNGSKIVSVCAGEITAQSPEPEQPAEEGAPDGEGA